MSDLKHIREQIAGLDGFLYSIKNSTNWGKEYGTYAPLEKRVNDIRDTMQALLDVAGVGQEIHDWRWKYRDTYRDTESAVKDLDLVIARLTHALTKLQEQNDVHD